MENKQTKTAQQKHKKANAMQKLGKSIKNTFIEMSSSLAGWIDDTGAQFSGQKSKKKTAKSSGATFAKTNSIANTPMNNTKE